MRHCEVQRDEAIPWVVTLQRSVEGFTALAITVVRTFPEGACMAPRTV